MCTRTQLFAILLAVPLFGCAAAGEGDTDALVVYGILDTEIFLFDQNLVGQPTGAQDLTVDCPLGGTVHITGTTTSDTQATVDLTYDFSGCANSGSGYDLALTGAVLLSGSFDGTGYKALSSVSDSLAVIGSVDAADVDDTCALAVTDRGSSGEASVVSGQWCDRDVEF